MILIDVHDNDVQAPEGECEGEGGGQRCDPSERFIVVTCLHYFMAFCFGCDLFIVLQSVNQHPIRV